MGIQLTSETLYMITGSVISLIFDLFPWLATWYQSIKPNNKRWVMIFVLIIVSASMIGLSCWEVTAPLLVKHINVTCTEAGIVEFVEIFFYTLIANQATFLLNPFKPNKPKNDAVKKDPYQERIEQDPDTKYKSNY